MTFERFGLPGLVLLSGWILLAIFVTVDPKRVFSMLSLGRVFLPNRLVGVFRVLGVVNAIGSVYLITRSTF